MMNAPFNFSSDETQEHLLIAQALHAEAWTRWLGTVTTMVARTFRAALRLATKVIEAVQWEQRRRATFCELSRLAAHVLKDFGLAQSGI
jgi:uncharacterized protein YjiS (DUF1127 family)